MRRGFRRGVDLFVEDGAYTTLASAVALLATMALLFSAVGATWSLSRAGDTQTAADATALAGANVVCSYHTVATVLDSCILSLGLAGLSITGAGVVGLFVPGANVLAIETIDTGIKMLRERNDFARSASRGLSRLESSLPSLVALNASRTCAAQQSDEISYSGTALAIPSRSASNFTALEGQGVDIDELEKSSGDLEDVSRRLEAASRASAAAKRTAWLADCGRDGANMQERAESLTSLPGDLNPDYRSSVTWEPSVALDRTRAYYSWRLANNKVEEPGIEGRADAAAREAFYRFASAEFSDAHFGEREGRVVCRVPLLPKNADDMRATVLYTEASWPSSLEPDGLTLHCGADCPGARGASGPLLPLSSIESGGARECGVCRFGIGDLGRVPAASTSIDNGYEYHLRAFTEALGDYAAARSEELALEREAQQSAEGMLGSFEGALDVLAGARPRIAPPGRYGCVSFVASGDIAWPEQLEGRFSDAALLGSRGAVSGAVAAPDEETRENNVLSQFFSALEERSGGAGAAGLVDDVMDLWGRVLVSYGDIGEGFGRLIDDFTGGAAGSRTGSIAMWLGDCIDQAVRGTGIEPADLRLRKPVLVDTSRIIDQSDEDGLKDIQGMLRSIPVGATDPEAIARALGYELGERILGGRFTVASIPLPGGSAIPLTIRLDGAGSWLPKIGGGS